MSQNPPAVSQNPPTMPQFPRVMSQNPRAMSQFPRALEHTRLARFLDNLTGPKTHWFLNFAETCSMAPADIHKFFLRL